MFTLENIIFLYKTPFCFLKVIFNKITEKNVFNRRHYVSCRVEFDVRIHSIWK